MNCFSLHHSTYRFHVAIHCIYLRLQMALKCGKNINDTLTLWLVCHFFVLPTFWCHRSVICYRTDAYTKQHGIYLFLLFFIFCDESKNGFMILSDQNVRSLESCRTVLYTEDRWPVAVLNSGSPLNLFLFLGMVTALDIGFTCGYAMLICLRRDF